MDEVKRQGPTRVLQSARKTTSESVQAVATVLDESETADTHRAIVKRYGLIGQMFNLYNRLRGNHLTDVGIEIKPVAASRR